MNTNLVKKVLLAETILRYTEKIKKILVSDILWYELLKMIGTNLSLDELKSYIHIMFKIDNDDFEQIQKNYREQLEQLKRWGVL